MWKVQDQTKSSDRSTLAKARGAVEALKRRSDLGFLKLPERSDLWTSSAARATELRASTDRLVVLGMGGSSLGGRALLQATGHDAGAEPRIGREVVFLDNVDAEKFSQWLASPKINSKDRLKRSSWALVSKSGNTIETLTMAEFIDQHLRAQGLGALATCSTAITENADNPLTRWARKNAVPELEIPKDVGGRFSVLTPVGLLPAAFAGLNLDSLRQGASWAYAQDDLLTELTAQTLMSYGRKEIVTFFWAYAGGLRDYGLWMQQLWAESLGKAKNRQGGAAPAASVPIPAVGSSDQHSILQQVMEGPCDKFLWFFRVGENESTGPRLEKNLFDGQDLMRGKSMGALFSAMAEATREALAQQQKLSLTLKTEKLDEVSVGALLMLSELVVGALGEALDIDAFNQPGVELGKRLARGILQA